MAKKKTNIPESKLEAFIKLKLYGIGIILSTILGCMIVYGIWRGLHSLSFLTVAIISFIVAFLGINWSLLNKYLSGENGILETEIVSIVLSVLLCVVMMIPLLISNGEGLPDACQHTSSDKYTWDAVCLEEESINTEIVNEAARIKEYDNFNIDDTYTTDNGYVVQSYSIKLDKTLVEEVCWDNLPGDSRLHDDNKYPSSFDTYIDLRPIGGFWCEFKGGTYNLGDVYYLDWNNFVEKYKDKLSKAIQE